MDDVDADDFSPLMVRRQVLLWVLATRRQLDRWERLVAAIIRERGKPPPTLIWQAEAERQFAFVAARHVLRAVERPGWDGETGREVLRTLGDLRDVGEHWDGNMPVFSVTPRQRTPPRRSGQRLVEDDPSGYPFSQFGWSSTDGPVLWPGLPTSKVRQVLDDLEREALSADPSLAKFVPPPSESPWLGEAAGRDSWWPKPEEES